MVAGEKKSTADAQILIFETGMNISLHVDIGWKRKKSTADVQILIFKLGNNIYLQMKCR